MELVVTARRARRGLACPPLPDTELQWSLLLRAAQRGGGLLSRGPKLPSGQPAAMWLVAVGQKPRAPVSATLAGGGLSWCSCHWARGRSLPCPKLPRSLSALHPAWETRQELTSEEPYAPRRGLGPEVKPPVPA